MVINANVDEKILACYKHVIIGRLKEMITGIEEEIMNDPAY